MTRSQTVRLGYALGSGEPVEVPITHMVVTGLTQHAGKTTALEGLITRSKRKALAFLTKRGESAFGDAHQVRPYFREDVDWEFVASVLESSRGEKMRLERSFIIKATRGAETLADVQNNVRAALANPKTRGFDNSIYTTLDAYLEKVVPQIERVSWAKSIDLKPGINVMDLVGLNDDMQQLVIRASMLWLHEIATETIVVVPEAWKFVPQGRRSPVKLAAESFIRQGAAIGNFVWLDSQDIAGVDKPILKMVPVWILGVQRESNEIDRTLAQIPDSVKKPKRKDIATLELGQFIACYGKHTIPTYAQPAWMNDAQAEQVATGALALDVAAKLSPRPLPHPSTATDNRMAYGQDVAALERENERLRGEIKRLQNRVEELARASSTSALSSNAKAPVDAPTSGRRVSGDTGSTPVGTERAYEYPDAEALYQMIKARLINEAPGILRVLAIKPELTVEIERKTLSTDGASLRGRVARLIASGFFKESRRNADVKRELERTGAAVHNGNLSRDLHALVVDGFLTDEEDGFRAAPGMKVNTVER